MIHENRCSEGRGTDRSETVVSPLQGSGRGTVSDPCPDFLKNHVQKFTSPSGSGWWVSLRVVGPYLPSTEGRWTGVGTTVSRGL